MRRESPCHPHSEVAAPNASAAPMQVCWPENIVPQPEYRNNRSDLPWEESWKYQSMTESPYTACSIGLEFCLTSFGVSHGHAVRWRSSHTLLVLFLTFFNFTFSGVTLILTFGNSRMSLPYGCS